MNRLRSMLILALLACGPVIAAEPACTQEPRSKWLARNAVRAQVEARGYKVVAIEVENGCYAVEVRDKNGKEWDLYLNPVTGELVRREEDV